MIVISIFNEKGGVGKTSGCISLGSVLNMIPSHKKVLLVDGDPSCNLSKFFADAMSYSAILPTLDDYLQGIADADELVRTFRFTRYPGDRFIIEQESESEPMKTKRYIVVSRVQYEEDEDEDAVLDAIDIEADEFTNLKASRSCSVSLIAGSKTFARYNFENEGDQEFLRNLLASFDQDYDICLIDCPPENMAITDPILKASDYTLIPMEASNDSINGLSDLLGTVNDIHSQGYPVQCLGTYFTKLEKNSAIPKKLTRNLAKVLSGTNLLLNTVISKDSLQEKSRDAAIPLPVYRRSAPLAKQYEKLANEILSKIEG